MPTPRIRLRAPSVEQESTAHAPAERASADLVARFDAVRAALGVPPSFAPEVEAAAVRVVARQEETLGAHTDLTDLPFVTLDPLGSTDLDQAMHLTRCEGGYRVDYAIADVPAFVEPDGEIAREATRRGQTVYAPDRRTPLHPTVLSEDAASLLEGQVRPAFVWSFDLDARGAVQSVDLVRALVRSRARLDYGGVQALLDDEAAPDPGDTREVAVLLREIGLLRQGIERERGGASLPLPEQEVEQVGDGFRLRVRAVLPVEDWNAQLSLMTGMAAADLMLRGGVGLLRTLPPPPPSALQGYRALAERLGVAWPAGATYGEFLRGLDPAVPAHLGLLNAASALFRGSGYTAFDGAAPEQTLHAAVGAPYAHVTAPLRRLVDRFGLVAAWSAHRGEPVPGWVREGLAGLPEVMASTGHRASEVERGCLDVVEAVLLGGRVGESFDAVVIGVDRDGRGGRVQLGDPAVVARCTGSLALGSRCRVTLSRVDVDTPEVLFTAPSATSSPGA